MGRIVVALILTLWAVPISILVNKIVPDPYMDEIFHIPQVQQYCKGNFRSWDPMITTPPGLYYLSLVHVASLFPGMFCIKAASTFSDSCSTAILRSTNVVLAILCGIIVYEIIKHLRPALDDRKAMLYAVILAIYPLHWFFTFLYYTDVASLTAVLATYLACLKKNYLFSGLLGAVAVVIRQTNIIWVLFVACSAVIEITLANCKYKFDAADIDASGKKNGEVSLKDIATLGTELRKRKVRNPTISADTCLMSNRSASKDYMSDAGLLDEIKAIFLTFLHLKSELLVSFTPFIILLATFIAFVYWNGSVVLGAKEAHAVSPHFAQLMYFGLFSTLAAAPLCCSLGQVVDVLHSIWKNRPLSFLQVLLALTASFISIHYFSIAHPYLLADNRHYPFYLWRKVIKVHWSIKYVLVPFYAYCWMSIISRLGKFQSKIWVLTYFLATAAVLIPAPLIEFRYYTIPFFFFILHSHANDYQSWLSMGVCYIVVNIFTLMMFLYRPFHWDHERGTQRFIW